MLEIFTAVIVNPLTLPAILVVTAMVTLVGAFAKTYYWVNKNFK